MTFQTEFPFTLPRGYVDAAGQVHRDGVMRLALAIDEIEVVHDPRAQQNSAYVPLLLLSRVVRCLGDLPAITPEIVGALYVIDLSYLEDIYQRINSPEAVTMGVVCPQCSERLLVRVAPLGG